MRQARAEYGFTKDGPNGEKDGRTSKGIFECFNEW